MNDVDTTAQSALDILAPYILETSRPIPRRVDVRIKVDDLVPAVKALLDANWGYLVAITGIDRPAVQPTEGEPEGEDHIEVLYSIGQGPVCLFLRLMVPYSAPQVQSVCGLIPSATLYERELMELFGVDVVGTPDRRRLIVAEEFPEGIYPMRKSFKAARTMSSDEDEVRE